MVRPLSWSSNQVSVQLFGMVQSNGSESRFNSWDITTLCSWRFSTLNGDIAIIKESILLSEIYLQYRKERLYLMWLRDPTEILDHYRMRPTWSIWQWVTISALIFCIGKSMASWSITEPPGDTSAPWKRPQSIHTALFSSSLSSWHEPVTPLIAPWCVISG